MATLDQLAQSAQLGTLTTEQKAFYEGHSAEKAGAGGEGENYSCLLDFDCGCYFSSILFFKQVERRPVIPMHRVQ